MIRMLFMNIVNWVSGPHQLFCSGTLISIPDNYTCKEVKMVYDRKHGRFILISWEDTTGNRLIIGAIYLRLALMNDTVATIRE